MEAAKQEAREMEISAEETKAQSRETYIERIMDLPAEDQAFMEGYTYALVTRAGKKGA